MEEEVKDLTEARRVALEFLRNNVHLQRSKENIKDEINNETVSTEEGELRNGIWDLTLAIDQTKPQKEPLTEMGTGPEQLSNKKRLFKKFQIERNSSRVISFKGVEN